MKHVFLSEVLAPSCSAPFSGSRVGKAAPGSAVETAGEWVTRVSCGDGVGERVARSAECR